VPVSRRTQAQPHRNWGLPSSMSTTFCIPNRSTHTSTGNAAIVALALAFLRCDDRAISAVWPMSHRTICDHVSSVLSFDVHGAISTWKERFLRKRACICVQNLARPPLPSRSASLAISATAAFIFWITPLRSQDISHHGSHLLNI
jgi:hypothetical protein